MYYIVSLQKYLQTVEHWRRTTFNMHVRISFIPPINLRRKAGDVIARTKYQKVCRCGVWMIYVTQNPLADFGFAIGHAHIHRCHLNLTPDQKHAPDNRRNRSTGDEPKNDT